MSIRIAGACQCVGTWFDDAALECALDTVPLNDSSAYFEELGVLPVEYSLRKSIASASKSLSWARVRQAGVTITDQVLSVGGMFLVNVALARTQSREEYGLFALACSAFTFLMALHNAVILETFTVYGSGRYQKHLVPYLGLVWRSNKPNLVFYAYAFSGAATFIFSIPVVMHWGLRGAVYGMLVSGAAYTMALAGDLSFLLLSESRTRGSDSLAVRS